VAYSITVSCDSLGNWLIWTGKQTLYIEKDKLINASHNHVFKW